MKFMQQKISAISNLKLIIEIDKLKDLSGRYFKYDNDRVSPVTFSH